MTNKCHKKVSLALLFCLVCQLFIIFIVLFYNLIISLLNDTLQKRVMVYAVKHIYVPQRVIFHEV